MLTAEVTPYSCNGKRETTRKEMEKGFLFDGVHVSGNKPSVNQTVEGSSLVFPHLTNAPFPIGYEAVMIAQVTFYFLLL